MAQNYDVGTRAWQPDPTEGWVASEVEEKRVQGDKVQLIFKLANGEVRPPSLPLATEFLPLLPPDGADGKCSGSQGPSKPQLLR